MKNTPQDVTLQPFQQIANGLLANTTYTAEWPAAYDYWAIHFALGGGLLPAHIVEIRLKANGNLIQQVTGPDLDLLNTFYRMPASGAVAGLVMLALPMRRFGILGGVQGLDMSKTPPTLLSGSEKDLSLESTLNCGSFDGKGRGITSLTCELVFNGTPAIGVLTVTPSAEATDPYPGGPGLLPILTRNVFNAVVGNNVMSKANAFLMGDIQHQMLDAIHMIPAAGTTPDNFVMWLNGNLVMQRTDLENQFKQQQANLRTPIAGMFSFDFTADGHGDQALGIGLTATEIRMQFANAGAAGAIAVYQKSLGKLWE